MRDIRNYSLLQHNTFGIDARCSRFLEYGNEEEACEVAAILRQEQQPFIIIGEGSNLLLTGDYDGIVVHSVVKGIQSGDFAPSGHEFFISAGSGETFDDLICWALNHNMPELVNLSLIPGEVGASAVQNIGAYGVEVGQYIDYIYAIDIATGERRIILGKDCGYGYRQSRFKREWKNRYLILSVTYLLSTNYKPCLDYGNIRSELERRGISEPTPLELRQVIIDIRRAKLPDPKVEGNAGSFFMNPVVPREKYEELAAQYETVPHYIIDNARVKIPAGWMIDQCGWKGRSLGRAGVHDKQALVLVNKGGATGNEIVALCRQIQQDVKAKFGIDIYPEVNIV